MDKAALLDFRSFLDPNSPVVVRQPGELIIDMLEPGDSMYVLRSGEAAIKVGDIVLETVGPGAVVGEMALLDEQMRSANVVAVRPCEVVAIDRASCLELVRQQPAFALELMRLIVRRLRAMNFYAHHDPVTRLPNRASLEEHLRGAVSRAKRQGKPLVLLTVDVSGLQEIDELLGYAAGDTLLDIAVRRLHTVLHDADFVARVGGHQFAVVLEELDEVQSAARVAQQIVAEMARPFPLAEQHAALTAAVGISSFPQDGSDGKDLVRAANSAVSRAKEQGGDPCQFFSPELNVRALEALAITNKLKLALERDEFTLHYQPLVELATNRVVGAEALIRWHEPLMGLIAPATFIPLAERRGLIAEIGDWVLMAACRRAREWQLSAAPPCRVTVNLSLAQLHRPDLAARIGAILRESGLPPALLELELTETYAMREPEATGRVLDELHEMGVGLAIDDFGTGYSSLSHLKRFPVDRLKIDRSFIQGIPGDEDDAAIARTIIAMARSLGISVVAEGVETAEQRAFLIAEGCEEAQGYAFGRAMPPEQLLPLLLNGLPK
ncbi:MAG: EAL domain-containing protein [Vicinamibacteria bacterium]|nr:EAL domain-containing protein [Vicinamibacteria bacterium]